MTPAPLPVAILGLGRMGRGLVTRWLGANHPVIAYDPDPEARNLARSAGATVVDHQHQLIPAFKADQSPRVVWLMVPAGTLIDRILWEGDQPLAAQLSEGDIIVDGGNSNFRDSMRRGERLIRESRIHYLDCGTSGGVAGEDFGFCLMVGGVRPVYDRIAPLFKALAAPQGYAHVGSGGAGHFVKMVHNAIEYGLLQVIGEGFSLMDHSPFDIDAAQVAELWNRGSVIRSWLMELVRDAMQRQAHFDQIAAVVGGGSTGTWAVDEAAQIGIKMPAIETSLRQRQQPENDYAARIVSALRYEFGRHPFELLQPPPTGQRQTDQSAEANPHDDQSQEGPI